jgi:hypothetical protein
VGRAADGAGNRRTTSGAAAHDGPDDAKSTSTHATTVKLAATSVFCSAQTAKVSVCRLTKSHSSQENVAIQ